MLFRSFDGENWATSSDGIGQVGCVHTCQGVEFDWLGVLIGATAGAALALSGIDVLAKFAVAGIPVVQMLALPLFLVLLAFAAPLWAVAASSFLLGACIEVFGILWFTALQTHVPSEAISRVSAYDAMGSLMFGPIGLALAGPLIGVVGLQTGFLVAAAVITVALLATLLSASVRNVRSAPVSA